LSFPPIEIGMPVCKIGAVTGFVNNTDGTVSAVGILTSALDDNHRTYFILVHPLLAKWGLRVLP
jgi:hypothetical protein